MKTVLKTVIKAVVYSLFVFALTIGLLMFVYKLNADGETVIKTFIPVIIKSTAVFAAISGVCFAIVGLFKRLPAIFGYLIDFCLSYGAFCIWYKMLSSSLAQPMSRFFAVSTVYVIVFAVVACLRALIKRIFRSKKKPAADKEYENQFLTDDTQNN